jgi:hypothetical protein
MIFTKRLRDGDRRENIPAEVPDLDRLDSDTRKMRWVLTPHDPARFGPFGATLDTEGML